MMLWFCWSFLCCFLSCSFLLLLLSLLLLLFFFFSYLFFSSLYSLRPFPSPFLFSLFSSSSPFPLSFLLLLLSPSLSISFPLISLFFIKSSSLPPCNVSLLNRLFSSLSPSFFSPLLLLLLLFALSSSLPHFFSSFSSSSFHLHFTFHFYPPFSLTPCHHLPRSFNLSSVFPFISISVNLALSDVD